MRRTKLENGKECRWCGGCKLWHPLTEEYWYIYGKLDKKVNKTYQGHACKIRLKAYNKSRPATDYRKAYMENYENSSIGKYKRLLRVAAKRDIYVGISLEQFEDLIKSESCVYCFESNRSRHGYGLDRVDSSKGYEIDNLVSCCDKCNKIKGDDRLSYEEMRIAMRAVLEYRERKNGKQDI